MIRAQRVALVWEPIDRSWGRWHGVAGNGSCGSEAAVGGTAGDWAQARGISSRWSWLNDW